MEEQKKISLSKQITKIKKIISMRHHNRTIANQERHVPHTDDHVPSGLEREKHPPEICKKPAKTQKNSYPPTYKLQQNDPHPLHPKNQRKINHHGDT